MAGADSEGSEGSNRKPDQGSIGNPGESDAIDPLRTLEARLERASMAAEKLLAEAAWTAAERLTGTHGPARTPGVSAGDRDAPRREGSIGAPKPPPAGWETPSEPDGAGDGAADMLMRTANRLQELIPADLRRRLAEALRELLLALRALIDWSVARLERRHATTSDLQDIPIL